MQHVWSVLQRLLENQLFVEAEKCLRNVFPSIVNTGNIQMDPTKVKVVTDWPSRKELQRFLGFLHLPPYSPFLNPLDSSWWSWTPRTPKLGQYSPSGPRRIINFTHVPTSPASSPAQRNYDIGNREPAKWLNSHQARSILQSLQLPSFLL